MMKFMWLIAVAGVFGHQDVMTSSDVSSSIEKEKPPITKMRRSIYARTPSWEYDGLPIEFPGRRIGDSSNELVEKNELSSTTDKYMKPTKKHEDTTTSTTAASPPLDRRYRRIFNPDETAVAEDFPYMAALLVNGELWCGAVVIATDRVLTAAHCLQLQYNNRFFREYMRMLSIRVGSSNATTGGLLYRVAEIFFHPNYDPQTLAYNVAVLKVHKNMTFGREPRVDRIEYSREKAVPVDSDVLFLGWGAVLGYGGTGGQVLLQKVTLPVYDIADCQEIYGRTLVTRNNFCAGFITIPKNVCNHDAGGPAIMYGKLMGILSFSSKRCDQVDQPAVFTTIGAVVPWIESVGERMVQLRNSVIKAP